MLTTGDADGQICLALRTNRLHRAKVKATERTWTRFICTLLPRHHIIAAIVNDSSIDMMMIIVVMTFTIRER